MEEPGRLQFMGSLRVGHDWVTSLSLFTFMHWRKWQPTPVFLPGESQGWGSLVGCCLWSCRVIYDWSDLAAAAVAAAVDQTTKSPLSLNLPLAQLDPWPSCIWSSSWTLYMYSLSVSQFSFIMCTALLWSLSSLPAQWPYLTILLRSCFPVSSIT